MGSHSMWTHWMYRYCVLIFGLMIVQWAETYHRVFNINYHYMSCYWLNILLYYCKILTKGDRKHLNVYERKVYRRILGPVYDNEKENWRILTNKEIYAIVKKLTIIETVRLNRLRWFGYVQRMEENRIPKRVLYMNLGTARLTGRPRNRWQDKVREDGRIVDGEGWQEKVHNREEWKKPQRTARNRLILHMPMEWMNEWMDEKNELLQNTMGWLSKWPIALWVKSEMLIKHRHNSKCQQIISLVTIHKNLWWWKHPVVNRCG